MASIKDVAKRAGVAISTVSKVLNGYAGVSAETKERVNEAIEALSYTPNAMAAALSSGKSGRVALLLNLEEGMPAVDEIDLQYLAGAIQRARELKIDVITLFFSMLKDKGTAEVVNYLKAQSIEGIIIYGMEREDPFWQKLIESGEFKTVVVDAPFCDRNTSSVWIDQRKAQYDVAKKTILENENCRRVLYIAGKKESYVTWERIRGMQELAEELDLKLTVEYGDFSERKARELTFYYEKETDVFVCASDLMAIGAMRALMELDVFHPVCGFDGITLMGYAGKQMNTVRQNFFRISAAAVEEVGRLMEGQTGRNLVLDYELIRMQYQDIIK
ncbi:MAG TPA: LacI family transcriptional regulator [Candidatus Eisenbergiella pullicola]|nr:LacI family transcriptional regulator [Candidatus Eisenbergiella pullicola]